MAQTFTMTQDIVEEHKLRMQHLSKYYPFFKIMETSFSQYKDGKYTSLDMGYISLAILRFFMEENSFKDKEVTYNEYLEFMGKLLRRDFSLELEEEEERELAGFIFDKLKNDGKPFLFPYYEPTAHKSMVMRTKLLESRMENQVLYYSITAEAIEFYLETKEFKEQSTITIEQLLLEKMIRARNFKGGTEVVRRINNEVRRLQAKKNEVLGILSFDVFEGMKAYEEFMEHGTKWFEEEEKLFKKNSELIRLALEKTEVDRHKGQYQSQYYKAMEEIYTLEREMNRALVAHGELLAACMDLQKKADELVYRAKLRTLRPAFDFSKMVRGLMERDQADMLGHLIEPLLKLRIRKTFPLRMIDDMLTYRPEKEEVPEAVNKASEEQYVYKDELEDNRIAANFQTITTILLRTLVKKGKFLLSDFYEEQKMRQEDIVRNGDFYTYLIHMSQKTDYNMKEVRENPDTFFEEMLADWLREHGEYLRIHMRLEMLPGKKIVLEDTAEVTDIRFELVV